MTRLFRHPILHEYAGRLTIHSHESSAADSSTLHDAVQAVRSTDGHAADLFLVTPRERLRPWEPKHDFFAHDGPLKTIAIGDPTWASLDIVRYGDGFAAREFLPYRASLDCIWRNPLDTQSALSVFRNLCSMLSPFWGQLLIADHVGSEHHVSPNMHISYVPHIASANCYGGRYHQLFGGADAYNRAGFDEVIRLPGESQPVMVVLDRTFDSARYILRRTEIESRLGPGDWFDKSKASHQALAVLSPVRSSTLLIEVELEHD